MSAAPPGEAGTSAGKGEGSAKNSQPVSADPNGKAGTSAKKVGHPYPPHEWKDVAEKQKVKIIGDGNKRRQKERQKRLRKKKREESRTTNDAQGARSSCGQTWREDAERRINLLAARPKRKARPIETETETESDAL